MGNKLKMKDIITLAIFNVAILVVMVVVKMVIMMVATPAFNYLAYVESWHSFALLCMLLCQTK